MSAARGAAFVLIAAAQLASGCHRGVESPVDGLVRTGDKADGAEALCHDVAGFATDRTLALGDRAVTIDSARGHVAITSSRSTIHFGPIYVELGGQTWRATAIESARADGDDLELTWRLAGKQARSRLRVVDDGVVRFSVEDWGGHWPTRAGVLLPTAADEHFFGFGEKFNAFDQAGRVVEVRTSDHAGDKGDHAYKAAPWFVSSRGHGVHLDTALTSRFDLGATTPGCVRIELRDPALALHVVEGPRPQDVLARWTALIGRPAPLPDWAYAPWISSDVWRDGGEVRYVVEQYAARDLPAAVFVFDSPWAVAYNDFVFNESQFAQGGDYEGEHYDGFASMPEMMGFLRAHGLRVVVWMTPFLNVESFDEGIVGANLGRASSYADARDRGLFVTDAAGAPIVIDWWKGRGSLLDFTNPETQSWIDARLHALVDSSGGVISGWKTDAGESDYLPDDARLADGTRGWQAKNRYAFEYQRAIWSVLGTEGLIFARSGFVGAQAFPAHWAGDNEGNFGEANGLPSVIVAAQSAAMSGYVYWASDIGGYLDSHPSTTPANLFMRWTQFAALTPIFAMHRQVGAGRAYPWSYGAEALSNYRRYAKLHTSLSPYLRALAVTAQATGLPMIRPLALVNAADPRSFTVKHTYLLGDWLLVAPMTTNHQTSRTLLAPPGRWIDFWSDREIEGGDFVTIDDAEQQHLPLLVKAGAIVPLLPEDDDATPDELALLLVPDATRTAFALHDDSRVALSEASGVVTIEIDAPARPWRLLVRATVAPQHVRQEGRELGADRWSFATGRLTIRLPAQSGPTRIEID